MLNSIIIRYGFDYVKSKNRRISEKDSVLKIGTNSILHFFEPGTHFIKPYFDYDESFSDYQKITGLTYNEDFWLSNNSFVYSDSLRTSVKYFIKNGFLQNFRRSHNENRETFRSGFFENNYLPWSAEKRLAIRSGNVVQDTVGPQAERAYLDREKYKLRSQIFLDINESGDSLAWFSKTIFDTYRSYCFLEPTKEVNCFINIFFDLFEIRRRELENQLAAKKRSVSEIDSLYKSKSEEAVRESELYLSEVNMGANLKSLQQWNDYVFSRLGIDNIQMFEISKNSR